MDQEQLFLQLGSLDGRMASIESGMAGISEALQKLAANDTRLSRADLDIARHDKRIGDLENKCYERAAAIESIAEHIAGDKPVGVVAGEWALRTLMVLSGALSLWLWERLPKILELLK